MFFAVAALPASAQDAPTAASFEGVWQITRMVRAGVADDHPQPSLLIFSRGYYSIIRTTGSKARLQAPPAQDPKQLSDAEKIARYDEWAPFAASAGSYEVSGNTLITHNLVAKNVKGMTRTEEAVILEFDGNRFVATSKPGEPDSDTQSVFTRLR